MADDLLVTGENGVLRLTLNRPPQLNALTGEMADLLAETLEGAAHDDDVRVVLVTGAAGVFSSGADLSGANAHEELDVNSLDRADRIIRAVVGLPQPCVAAVEGVAAGVGCSVALACDLVVAAESAVFLLAFTRIGLMPDGGATATAAVSMGRARAMRMALLAEPLSGREAFEAGLVSHVVRDGEVATTAETIVDRLRKGPPLAYAATKKALNAATLAELEGALARERVGQTVLLGTADAAEGIRAFVQKRRPRFGGD